MDFHTMVSGFKRNVLEEKKISELTTATRKLVRQYISDGTPDRQGPRFSFNNLFEDEKTMRVIFPLGIELATQATDMFKRIVDRGWQPAFTFKTVDQKMTDQGGREYTVPTELPVLIMKKEEKKVIPKGPRAGETVTDVKKVSLGKLVEKFGTSEDKAWWKQNQNMLREMDNVRKFFLKPFLNNFEVDISNKPHVIITRHPIDVARMSDFGVTRSCHSEGSSHFNCAIDESRGHGMVAYLMRGADVAQYNLIDRINAEEIFGDSHIDLDGPEPVARVRIYKLFNAETGEDFGVAEDRVYGARVPDFLPTVRQWLRQNQRDMWANEEGNIDPSAIGNGDFIRIGGEYTDIEQGDQGDIGDLIALLFKGTSLEEQAKEIFGMVEYQYEDFYDDKFAEDQQAQAEMDVNRLVTRTQEAVNDNISVYADIEDGWDEAVPFYVQGGFTMQFEFTYDDAWETKSGRTVVPDYRSSWQAQREFAEEIESVLDKAIDIYGYGENEIESSEDDNTFTVDYRQTFNFQRAGVDAVEDLESFLDYVVSEYNESYDRARGLLRQYFIENDYLPEEAFDRTVRKFTDDDFEGYNNLNVSYSEDDPSDGIDIMQDIPAHKLIHVPGGGLGYYEIAEFKNDTINQFLIGPAYRNMLRQGTGREEITADVRRTFKKLANEAFRFANAQVPLPFDKKFERKPKDMREMMPMTFTPELGVLLTSSREIAGAPGDTFKVGLRFKIKIMLDMDEEEIARVEAFIKYVDSHLDVLYKAAEKVANKKYDQLIGTLKRQVAVQFEETKLREAIKKAILKKLVNEQTGFETRMFQVNLKIQVDPSMGGGIEQKLNRIRAIEGVTVVGHDEPQRGAGREVIEARIKFHPSSDALRPGTYVSQVLVPEINSSKLVPGVKVIDVVRGSLKRLDK